MNNIILFENWRKTIKFSTTPIWIEYIYHNKGDIEKKHLAFISLKETENDMHVIHPISNFILENWKYHEFNTQRKHANNTVKFLNYLLKKKHLLKISNLNELRISHGSMYLNELNLDGVSKSTIKDAERTLTKFFYWICVFGTPTHLTKDLFQKTTTELGTYLESPFSPIYPSKEKKNIEHIFPMKFIPLLLEIAITVAKPIALGIYMQIFGGIRISEAVNLNRTQVSRSLSKGDFILKIQNNNFRTDLKEHASVKKARTQLVLQINDWGHMLFKDHVKLYVPTDHSNSLFVNRDGNALSNRSYRQYFDNVKRLFLEALENSNNSEYKLLALHLRNIKWSTHIGRGTFTNLIAEDAENPYDIAHLRGDSNIESALTYMVSTNRIHKKIEEKFSKMHGSYIPKLIERENKNEEKR